jgi:hypothetical protein
MPELIEGPYISIVFFDIFDSILERANKWINVMFW